MKKHILFIFSAVALIFGASISPALAVGSQPPSQEKKVQLSENQKAELKEIHKDILAKKKELIQKYVEFGMISKEMGDRMIQRYEHHYKMVEQNGFKMHHHRFHHKRQFNEKQPD
ncbi:DUF2680 domain-containing protein [Peribacillus cavernae]|uniref:DUF2680 domain-containing protein n=1 Tax=Peribacillus cavernae TaxID=1674310 RepID=A0A3S0VAQ4_9BACI|nr:DUF2680 domain-containing protein [Peribacillus cavernae]MDQ0217801.1 hypothetical protein [Peribacillus cavernae]RUQ28253.1 DUF2680 domain-containing protein [Peribacillus cavernae]